MKLQVTDDSGFLALIDPDAYSGFVAEDWDLHRLVARFRDQMGARHLLIWGTGQGGRWTVDVSLARCPASGVREVAGSIVATRGRLLLTNYESLTMAAQYKDVTLPEGHQSAMAFEVPPGSYRCRIVQHALTAGNWKAGSPPEFSLELEPAAVLDS